MVAKIFVAVCPLPESVIERALSGYELITAESFAIAEKLIRSDGIDVFVVSALWQESMGMELIKLVREDAKHKDTPILMVRLIPSPHADLITQVMKTMKAVKGISDYLEMSYDDERVVPVLRQTVEQLIAPHKKTSFN